MVILYFLSTPQIPSVHPPSCPPWNGCGRVCTAVCLGNALSSRSHPLFHFSFLLVCISTSLRKGAEKFFLFVCLFLTPCMFENSLVLFSCLIKFSWTQNSRLKISTSPISAVPWRQLLHCFQASDIAVETSGAVLLPDLWMGLLCLLSGRCESSLYPQYLGVSLWDASLCGSPRPHSSGHSEGLFYLEADLQYWEIFKILFSIMFSIFFSS